MVECLDQCVCPKCDHKGLYVNTEDWKPVQIRCRRLKCGWRVDLKQFWPLETRKYKDLKELLKELLKQMAEQKPENEETCLRCGLPKDICVCSTAATGFRVPFVPESPTRLS